ncbi:hypothetical protein [Thermosynechococcus sp. PKX82]|uniref:hypothetical protein n=1 Tax=Thermosynechococcus sp. PKX82 TaxID=3074086 RepID=UPI002873AD92|nr:hypothetical protein [Thermosynechococcus sp. PKX82]WNC30992.1 hypothetical protein RHH53_05425 [Thermosynechococcus sp. PKX82]
MEELLKTSQELAELFPDGAIFIGGIAVYLHSKSQGLLHLAESSHDGDFYISLIDFADLRDLEEITPNRRLNKYQLIKNGWEFDVYVERNNHLAIPFCEVNAEKIVIDNLPCACLEHLLILKLDAYSDRFHSSKGDKDKRDIIRILNMMKNPRIDILKNYLDQEKIKLIKLAISDNSKYLEMCKNNSQQASALRKSTQKNSQILLDLEV